MISHSGSTSRTVPNPRIAIVGGGITGLASALRLQTLAADSGKPCAVTLLEASGRTGGKLLSEQVDGFVVDAGPDIFLVKKSHGVALCETLGLQHLLQETDPARRMTYVRKEGGLEPITMYADETLVTLRGGIQVLADAATEALDPGTIVRDSRVTNIVRTDREYQVQLSDHRTIVADAVVVAIPVQQTVDLLSSLIPNTAELFKSVSYTSTTTVSVAYRASDVPHDLNGYGYLIPNAKTGQVSACTWSSSKIPGRAPAGHVLLRAFVRGIELSAEQVETLVLKEFRKTLGITTAPLFVRIYAWSEAIPVYGVDHGQRIAELARQLERFPGVTVAGSAIGATGIPDSIRSGAAAADTVWNYVTTGAWATPQFVPDATAVAQGQSFFAKAED